MTRPEALLILMAIRLNPSTLTLGLNKVVYSSNSFQHVLLHSPETCFWISKWGRSDQTGSYSTQRVSKPRPKFTSVCYATSYLLTMLLSLHIAKISCWPFLRERLCGLLSVWRRRKSCTKALTLYPLLPSMTTPWKSSRNLLILVQPPRRTDPWTRHSSSNNYDKAFL